jgi:hypothetical protein
MKDAFMPLMDKILLRKRSLIETVNDQLKNIAQVEHTRHRSVLNFMVNRVAGLISYTRQPKKRDCTEFCGTGFKPVKKHGQDGRATLFDTKFSIAPKKPTLRLHERDRQALNSHALPFVA